MQIRATLLGGLIAATSGFAVVAADGPIKIGVDTPLSGTYAGIGKQVRCGDEGAPHEFAC
jgi:branched-chain amino acid transport system substrate-binding protein